MGPCIPRVLFNDEIVGSFLGPADENNYRDVVVVDSCDAAVKQFCDLVCGVCAA